MGAWSGRFRQGEPSRCLDELVGGLKCRLCGKVYPKEALNFCTEDFGPLEVDYDYDGRRRGTHRAGDRIAPADDVALSRTAARRRRADRRPARRLHAADPGRPAGRSAWASTSCTSRTTPSIIPTLSFKDRVVAVALSKAVEFGFTTVGCASTGNLANSVAANAAAAGLEAYVFIPDGLEQGKVLGATIYGAKVIARRGQLRPGQPAVLPDRLQVRLGLRQRQPPAVLRRGVEVDGLRDRRGPRLATAATTSSRPMAGGSLIGKIHKAFKEFERLGLIDGPVTTRMFGAQATGCNPISNTVKTEA